MSEKSKPEEEYEKYKQEIELKAKEELQKIKEKIEIAKKEAAKVGAALDNQEKS